MTNKHTPGPWHVTTFPTMATPIVCAGPLPIAGLVAMPVPGGNAINGEVWANARLIAAAPELLAALKSATVALEQLVDIEAGSPAALTVAKARAAIAKAEGR